MANQMFETGSDFRIPFRGRQNAERLSRIGQPRATNKVTDRQVIRNARRANGLFKRAFDIVVSALALVFFAPAFVLIAALIKLTDQGPVFYSHTRVGRQGARFGCFKFRTMAVDSQERLAHILSTDPVAAAEWRERQKLASDPRVTTLGNFLRKWSIDELPQLWNVLKGDMSIIGPRPITRAELYRYGRDRRYYLLVRPGLTGRWQVNGRSSTGYDKRVEHDRAYVERWSWLNELVILVLTIPAILRTGDAG